MAMYPSLLEIKTICRGRENFRSMAEDMGEGLGRLFLQGGTMIERRAKIVITEKKHVVTGNLRRSITTLPRDWTPEKIEVAVQTPVVYAPKIEHLPDGGYMFPAYIQEQARVVRFIEKGVQAIIYKNVGRGL